MYLIVMYAENSSHQVKTVEVEADNQEQAEFWAWVDNPGWTLANHQPESEPEPASDGKPF